MITRKDYMDDRATFAQYYSEIAAEVGINYDKSTMMPQIIKAIKAGDEHLNTIDLGWWDSQGHFSKAHLALTFKLHGDNWSMAGSVCVHKQAARNAADKAMEVID